MVMYLCPYSNTCQKTKGLECALRVKLLEYTCEMSVVALLLLLLLLLLCKSLKECVAQIHIQLHIVM